MLSSGDTVVPLRTLRPSIRSSRIGEPPWPPTYMGGVSQPFLAPAGVRLGRVDCSCMGFGGSMFLCMAGVIAMLRLVERFGVRRQEFVSLSREYAVEVPRILQGCRHIYGWGNACP